MKIRVARGAALVGAAVLAVLAAGTLSYWMHAVGDAGPLVGYGHADADRQMPTAWLRLVVHVLVAMSVVVAGRGGRGASAALAAVLGTVFWLGMWAASHTVAALGYPTELANHWYVLVPPLIVGLYVLAVTLLAAQWRQALPIGGARTA